MGRAPRRLRRARRRAARLRHQPHVRQPAAGRTARTRPARLRTTPVWWTEWGVGSTHFGPIHDTVFGAPFVLSGYALGPASSRRARVLGGQRPLRGARPADRLFHNGFGLLTVGNLAKPRYWAAHLAAHQGDHVLATHGGRRRRGGSRAVLGHPPRRRHDRRPHLERHDQRGRHVRRLAAGPEASGSKSAESIRPSATT